MRKAALVFLIATLFAGGLFVCECAKENQELYVDVLSPHANELSDAWISLDSPMIACKVAKATKDNPFFYLTHSLQGAASFLGTPFIDWRVSDLSKHVLIYGHHIEGTSFVFSKLSGAYTPVDFSQVGNVVFHTRAGENKTYVPFAAAKVQEDCSYIQHFSFTTDADFSAWLSKVFEKGSAKATALQEGTWHEALTLCTCSESIAHKNTRTILTFVR